MKGNAVQFVSDVIWSSVRPQAVQVPIRRTLCHRGGGGMAQAQAAIGADRTDVQIALREGDFQPGGGEFPVDRRVQFMNHVQSVFERGQKGPQDKVQRAVAETLEGGDRSGIGQQ